MSQAPAVLYGPSVAIDSAAAWVLAVRKHNSLTQEQFAERIDADRVTVGKWEAGMYQPDFESVLAIMRAFPEAAAMLAGLPVKRPSAPPLRTPQAREIAHIVDSLPVKMRDYLRDMVYRVTMKQAAK